MHEQRLSRGKEPVRAATVPDVLSPGMSSGLEQVLRREIGFACKVDPQSLQACFVACRGDVSEVDLAALKFFQFFP